MVARLLYAAVPFLGQLAASELQSEGIGIDAFSIPSARAVLPYLKPHSSSVTRTPEGVLCERSCTLPLSPAIGLLPALVLNYRTHGVRTEAVRAEAEAREATEHRREEKLRQQEQEAKKKKREPEQQEARPEKRRDEKKTPRQGAA